MGLFKNLFRRGASIAQGAQMITQNGVPTVPTNPTDAINAAVIVKRDLDAAQYVAHNAGSAIQDIQASTTPAPTAATSPSVDEIPEQPSEPSTIPPIEPPEQPAAPGTPPPTSPSPQ